MKIENGENGTRIDQIRSYVIRTTRMSDHQKEAYQRLQHRYCVPVFSEDPGLLSWDQVFPHRRHHPERPIILDIGFGMGYELAELADRRRDQDFFGVEVHKPGVGKLLSEIERRSLTNVRIAVQDAVPVCRSAIPGASLSGVHLFFPDPWPKKRHHKRRLVRRGFPELIAPLLIPGGYLYLVTDWEDYALQMLDVMNRSELFKNRAHRFAEPQPWRPKTAFERKGLEKGHRIFELLYDRES